MMMMMKMNMMILNYHYYHNYHNYRNYHSHGHGLEILIQPPLMSGKGYHILEYAF